MNKINWFGLIGGALILVVVAASLYFPWWQLAIGDYLKINASPIYTTFDLFGSAFIIPLIWAFNIAGILALVFSGVVMLIYSILPTKSYSKDLLGFAWRKPLYLVVFFVVGLVATSLVVQMVSGMGIPLMGTSTFMISLPFGPSNSINMGAVVSGNFFWPFWLAIVSAALCVVARVYHGRLNKVQKADVAVPPPPPAPSRQAMIN